MVIITTLLRRGLLLMKIRRQATEVVTMAYVYECLFRPSYQFGIVGRYDVTLLLVNTPGY